MIMKKTSKKTNANAPRKRERKTIKKPTPVIPKGNTMGAVQEGPDENCEEDSRWLTKWKGASMEWVASDEGLPPDDFFFPSDNYPRGEIIAGIAAHLLEGEDFAMATRKALMLLAFANIAIEQEQEFRETMADVSHASYRRGISLITRQKRCDRATEYFQDFLADKIAREMPDLDPGEKREELCLRLNKFEINGFGKDLKELIQSFAEYGVTRSKKKTA